VLLDVNVTVAPPVGAAAFKVIVAMELDPPVTVVGFSVRPVIVTGLIVSVAVLVVPLNVPDTTAEVTEETEVVVTVKLAEVAPDGIVTDAGTVALVVLDERVTTTPVDPAGLLRVTMPVEDVPPVTEVGDTVTLVRVAALIVRVAV
jgi:hypothetical protein